MTSSHLSQLHIVDCHAFTPLHLSHLPHLPHLSDLHDVLPDPLEGGEQALYVPQRPMRTQLLTRRCN
eukprot:g78750.t1